MPRHIESRLQIACKKWFDLQYPKIARLCFAIPNGGYRSTIEAQFLKAEGSTAGVSDMILLIPSGPGKWSSLCIEFKAGTENKPPFRRVGRSSQNHKETSMSFAGHLMSSETR